MSIKQLKTKIEMEFSELFPREETYFVGKINDSSNYTLPSDSLVGDHFKHGDSIIVWPRADYEDFPHTYQKEEANDLLHSLKNVHYSMISKLSDSYIQEYTDKIELLNTILPLGLSEDVPTIQNICIILNKVLNRDVVGMLDDEENNSVLELAVLVMQHWISKVISEDKFVMNNTLMVLEMLIKSWSFCSKFKNRT